MTNNTGGSVNQSELRAFYNSDALAKVILSHFARFENNMSTTTVDALLSRLSTEPIPISRAEVIKFFQRLEELGCGKFISGRKGHRSRFTWAVRLTDVARAAAAAGQSVNIAAAPPADPAAELEEVEEAEQNNLLEHRFHLRKDLDVHFDLPGDLTAAEATRLSAFIQTLPFNESQE
jgi:hypothetical protein